MLAAESEKELRVKTEDVVWRSDEDEIVVLELTTGTYLTLNGSGKLLWLKLADGCTASALARQLQDAYGISEQRAADDTSAFVKELTERNLLAEET